MPRTVQRAVTEEGEERHLRQLQLVSELSMRLSTMDADHVLKTAIERITPAFDADQGAVYLEGGGVHRLVASVGISEATVERLRVFRNTRGPIGLAIQRKAPVRVSIAELDPEYHWYTEVEGQRVCISVPLLAKDRVVGAFSIGRNTELPFDDVEVALLGGLGVQLGIAIENARLYAEARRHAEALARAQEQVVRAERLAALGELAAIVAHEIRNPLGAIFNAVSGLKALLPKGTEGAELLRILAEESDRMNLIVGDLLEFSAPRPLALVREDLRPILEGAVQAALERASGSLRLLMEIPERLPDVMADARQLRQAFLNVALNAVQSMPAGGLLRVAAARDGDFVRASIADTGPGIPQEIRERIFEPFFTTRATGSGLGLPLVKRIVEAHRGALFVDSLPGAGTTFTIDVPVAPEGATGQARSP